MGEHGMDRVLSPELRYLDNNYLLASTESLTEKHAFRWHSLGRRTARLKRTARRMTDVVEGAAFPCPFSFFSVFPSFLFLADLLAH